eukprot:COSAG02_NODE_9845_length_2095_cov_1.153808_2_plen_150_part_00
MGSQRMLKMPFPKPFQVSPQRIVLRALHALVLRQQSVLPHVILGGCGSVRWTRVMGQSGMVKQVERGPCPLCRRELEWNTMVEYVRHIKANKLDVDGKYGEAAKDIVPYSLRSNTAVAARAGALGEVGHVEGMCNRHVTLLAKRRSVDW